MLLYAQFELVLILCCFCFCLSSYRKVSKQFRMREAAGDQISAVTPACTYATHSRVSQLQQESALPSSTCYSSSRAASPSAEFQPNPCQWPKNPCTSGIRVEVPGVWLCGAGKPAVQLRTATAAVPYWPASQHFYSGLSCTFFSSGCIHPTSF